MSSNTRTTLTGLLMRNMKHKMQMMFGMMIPQQKMINKVKGTVRPPLMMMRVISLLAMMAMR